MKKEQTQLDLETENPQLIKIRTLLSDQPRDRLLLEMMLQTTATVQDILALTVSDLKGLQTGTPLPLKYEADARLHIFSASMKEYFDKILIEHDPDHKDLVFESKKGKKALSKTSVSRLVRKWIIDSHMNCHGLRGLRSLNQSARPHARVPENQKINHSEYNPPKISTMTRQEAVFQELERAIISGEIHPGQRLSIEDIAQRMGVSRIPVREAMARLAERGFIKSRPQKNGSIVNELSRDNLKEILDLRLMLECEAVSKAALNIMDSTIIKLEETNRIFTRARKQNKADQLLAANRKFHLLAYRDSNSPILLETINQLWDKVSPYYNIMFRQSITTHPQSGANFHSELIKALRDRNAENAKHWLKTDLIHSAKFVLELFDLYQVDLGMEMVRQSSSEFTGA